VGGVGVGVGSRTVSSSGSSSSSSSSNSSNSSSGGSSSRRSSSIVQVPPCVADTDRGGLERQGQYPRSGRGTCGGFVGWLAGTNSFIRKARARPRRRPPPGWRALSHTCERRCKACVCRRAQGCRPQERFTNIILHATRPQRPSARRTPHAARRPRPRPSPSLLRTSQLAARPVPSHPIPSQRTARHRGSRSLRRTRARACACASSSRPRAHHHTIPRPSPSLTQFHNLIARARWPVARSHWPRLPAAASRPRRRLANHRDLPQITQGRPPHARVPPGPRPLLVIVALEGTAENRTGLSPGPRRR
jgi:hypothetical protein